MIFFCRKRLWGLRIKPSKPIPIISASSANISIQARPSRDYSSVRSMRWLNECGLPGWRILPSTVIPERSKVSWVGVTAKGWRKPISHFIAASRLSSIFNTSIILCLLEKHSYWYNGIKRADAAVSSEQRIPLILFNMMAWVSPAYGRWLVIC